MKLIILAVALLVAVPAFAVSGSEVTLTASPNVTVAQYGKLRLAVDGGKITVPGFVAAVLVQRGFSGPAVSDPRADLAASPYAIMYLAACGDAAARPPPPLADETKPPPPALTLAEFQAKALALYDKGTCKP